jgi:hypothetical protein
MRLVESKSSYFYLHHFLRREGRSQKLSVVARLEGMTRKDARPLCSGLFETCIYITSFGNDTSVSRILEI